MVATRVANASFLAATFSESEIAASVFSACILSDVSSVAIDSCQERHLLDVSLHLPCAKQRGSELYWER